MNTQAAVPTNSIDTGSKRDRPIDPNASDPMTTISTIVRPRPSRRPRASIVNAPTTIPTPVPAVSKPRSAGAGTPADRASRSAGSRCSSSRTSRPPGRGASALAPPAAARSQPRASGKSRRLPRRDVSSPGTSGSVSVRAAATAGPKAATVSAGAGPAAATRAPPSSPPTMRPMPNVIELSPRALARRFGRTTRPAITSDGADQNPSIAPTITAIARRTLNRQLAGDREGGGRAEDEHGHDLADHHAASRPQPVHEHAGRNHREERRQRPREEQEADGGGRARLRQDRPRERGLEQPDRDVVGRGSGEVAPVGRDAQRAAGSATCAFSTGRPHFQRVRIDLTAEDAARRIGGRRPRSPGR